MGSLETACGRFGLINNKQPSTFQDLQWLIGFVEAVGWGFVIKKGFYGVGGFNITLSIWQCLKEAPILYYIKCRLGHGHVGFLKPDLLG